MDPAPPVTSSSRSRVRLVALQLAIGALLGFVLWSIFGPQVVSWWYEPPSKDAFSCAGSVRGALGDFVKYQLLAALAGAIVVILLVLLARMLWARLFGRGKTPPPSVLGAPASPPPPSEPPPGPTPSV